MGDPPKPASARAAAIAIGEVVNRHWVSNSELIISREATRTYADGRVESGLRMLRTWRINAEEHACEFWFEWRV